MRPSQRASDLRTAREIAEMVLDLLVFVLVASCALAMRDCGPDDVRMLIEEVSRDR
jgi:hypothetical protein